jgi:hypothetical protein
VLTNQRTPKDSWDHIFLNYAPGYTEAFKRGIHARQDNACALCGERSQVVHHIYADYSAESSACIALCRDCHNCQVVHHDANWSAVLTELNMFYLYPAEVVRVFYYPFYLPYF